MRHGAAAARRHSRGKRLARLARHRLVVPILRARHPPEHTARAVAVGLGWALTPLVGVQLLLVAATWVVLSRALGWQFSLLIAGAWTFVSNVATMGPIYYVFYRTGLWLLGAPDGAEFDAFTAEINTALAEADEPDGLIARTLDLFGTYGMPMFVGSIPWAIAGALAGYWIGWRYATWRLRAPRARHG